MDIIQFLACGFEKMNIPATAAQLSQFASYYELLLDYNSRVNLTAITEPKDVCIKHFFDSAAVLGAVLLPMGASVIDVGTGAGFPGLPVKILRPDIRLTLIDSLRKRVDFLSVCVSELGLQDVVCVHARAEDAANQSDFRERYDVAVSRAVAAMPALCEYCLPFVAVGGRFAALKGPAVKEELSAAKNAIAVLGGADAKVLPVTIPESDLEHQIIVVEKLRQTPSKYPRRVGKVAKKPLL